MRLRIERDLKTDKYKVWESGITYHLPFELVASLRAYYYARRGSIASWYHDLPGRDRELVMIEGGKPATDEFYPDAAAD